MNNSNTKDFRSQCLLIIALTTFIVYIIWNLYWFSQGRLAPSMLLGLLGIPAPTTGMTRSFFAFISGDIKLSLSFNPFTFPTIALIIYSFRIFCKHYFFGHYVTLGPITLWSWVTILSASWIYQLIIL